MKVAEMVEIWRRERGERKENDQLDAFRFTPYRS